MTKCPECDRLMTSLTRIDDTIFDDDDDSESSMSSHTKSQRNREISFREAMEVAKAPMDLRHRDGRRLGYDVRDYHPKLKKSEIRFFHESDRYSPGEPITPSAKATAIKATTLRWLHEAPDDKILIFSQFKKMSVIIGRMLQDEEISFIYFDGGLNSARKHSAVQAFQDDPNIKVMVSSSDHLCLGGVIEADDPLGHITKVW